MMEKKLCLTLTVWLIAFVYTTKASPMTAMNDSTINNQEVQSMIHCKTNEVINIDKQEVCEHVCNLLLPTVRCSEINPPDCLCAEEYIRNHLNECIPLTKCIQNTSSDGFSTIRITLNNTQNANFTANQNVPKYDSETVNHVVNTLKRNLSQFLDSLRNRSQLSSGRNTRHADKHENSYQHYESLLKESFEKLVDQ